MLDAWRRKQRSLHWIPLTVPRCDRQLGLVDDVVARGHHLVVEGHPDHHVRERLRHERENLGIVVAEVVAPPERVVDTSSIETRDISFEVPEGTTEQVNFLLRFRS